MKDNKVTDEQIIKALECCITNDCAKCKAYDETNGEIVDCLHAICRNAFDLINRQKAEIKDLIEMTKEFKSFPCFAKDTQFVSVSRKADGQFTADKVIQIEVYKIRAEAITEYHEEVKKRCIEGGIYPAFVERVMLNVKKEMVGESK